MHDRTIPQLTPAQSTGTQAATPEQLRRSAELSGLGDATPKTIADRYDIQELLAKGGMGAVYRAWDRNLRRPIAVKIIHDHLLRDVAVKRFQYEALIAAQCQHPNIPPVYDLGVYEGVKPYLAMKLVLGRTLDDHIKRPGPDTPNLIAVFEGIAQAIGYAHSQGVIHRDLKPLNVMVGAFGEVQVMDWGLAKLLRDDAETTAPTPASNGFSDPRGDTDTRTIAGSVMGTPAYMPPEQASGTVGAITERSDVFGLGAILCAILTGKPVFIGSDGESTRLLAADGRIEDAFARLDGSGAEPEMIALAKHCLAPRPADRPADGNAVARAVGTLRAAADDRAKRAELGRARAEARRRVLAGSAAAVVVVLLAGIAGTALGLVEARKQEAEAKRQEGIAKDETTARGLALDAEKIAKAEAKANEQRALANLAFAKKGNEILGSVFAGLDPGANYPTVGEFAKALRRNVRTAVAALEGGAVGDPLDVAEMQNTLGVSLMGLGDPKTASELFAKARATREAVLGPRHPLTLQSLNNLASSYGAAGRPDRALPIYEQAFQLWKDAHGMDHPGTQDSMNSLAVGYRRSGKIDRAIGLLEEVVRLRTAALGPDHLDTLTSQSNLAVALKSDGQTDRALPLYEAVYRLRSEKLGADHPDTLTSLGNLAGAYEDAGQFARALPLYERTHALLKDKLGVDHPDTIWSLTNLAGCFQSAGQLDRGRQLWDESLKLAQAKLGPDHPGTLRSMHGRAEAYRAAGQPDQALPLLVETRDRRNAVLGPDHPHSLATAGLLAVVYLDLGMATKALPILEDTRRIRIETSGPNHPDTLQSTNDLAGGYLGIRRPDRALPLFEEVYAIRKSTRGADHPDTLDSQNNLAGAYFQLERFDDARRHFEESLKVTASKLGADHPLTLSRANNLAGTYRVLGANDKAIGIWESTLAHQTKRLGPDHPSTLATMGNLATGYLEADRRDAAWPLFEELRTAHRKRSAANPAAYASRLSTIALQFLALGEYARSENWLRECVAIREKEQPDVWSTFNAQSMLGEALLGQGKFKDAELFLIKGYEGLIARAKSIPPQGEIRIPEALDRLIWLYTATDRPAEAKTYRELRLRYPKEPAPKPRSPRGRMGTSR
jgi:tetratricopeptide (TPR) repeat protein